jgi:hypothetical protein
MTTETLEQKRIRENTVLDAIEIAKHEGRNLPPEYQAILINAVKETTNDFFLKKNVLDAKQETKK